MDVVREHTAGSPQHDIRWTNLRQPEIAKRISAKGTKVSRRIVRMNKRLAEELDSTVVERRGWCWAMRSFGVDAYKASETDLLAEG